MSCRYQPTTYSSKKKQTVGPIAGSILLGPVRWIIEQMQNCNNRYFSKGDLECPHCSLQCGSWERKSLCILGVFNPVDLFAINETVVRIKRRQKLRVAHEGKAVTRFVSIYLCVCVWALSTTQSTTHYTYNTYYDYTQPYTQTVYSTTQTYTFPYHKQVCHFSGG